MEKEKQLLIKCRMLIEQSLNWGESSAWGNSDFEQLSEKIFEKTHVQLSVSTLKRIWGRVRYENFPTTATLNALACFSGYDSWRDFKQKNLENESITSSAGGVAIIPGEKAPGPIIDHKKLNISYFSPKRVLATVGGLLVISMFVYIYHTHNVKSVDPSKIKFEAVKVSDSLPNSVIFNYDASAFKSDSVYIQQSWDTTRRERVAGNGKQHTSIYYNPGYFIAKLIVDNKIVKECIVNIKTKGWKGIIEKWPVPIYLSEKDIKHKGFMGITESLFRQKTGSPVFNGTWVKYANVRGFKGIDAANFSFEATVRNSSAIEASVCRQVKAIILGKGMAIIIPLADKGCISALNLLTGDNWISGKNHDMSAFGCDFSQFQNLKLVVEKHHFSVYLNNKMILNTQQKYTIGEIEGIRFEFEGAGEIKDVKLSTPGSVTYYDNF